MPIPFRVNLGVVLVRVGGRGRRRRTGARQLSGDVYVSNRRGKHISGHLCEKPMLITAYVRKRWANNSLGAGGASSGEPLAAKATAAAPETLERWSGADRRREPALLPLALAVSPAGWVTVRPQPWALRLWVPTVTQQNIHCVELRVPALEKHFETRFSEVQSALERSSSFSHKTRR